MMTDDERRKVFWLLKKYSSYTAWKALGDAYAKFVKAWERAIKLENKDEDTEFETEALKSFWDGQKGFDKGLPLLKRGERSVFRYRASGYLGWHASYALDYAQRLMDPREYVFDWMPNKKEVLDNFIAVSNLSSGLSGILERDDRDDSACFGTQTIFHKVYGPFNFPEILPEVPLPTDVVFSTGDIVTADGIWEPEWEISPTDTGVLSKLTGFITGQNGKLDKGCMNYLLSGTTAPPYQDSMDSPVIPVRWRLIWEDTRYRDGTIPEEEAQYCAPPAPVQPAPPNGKLRGLPNEVVPKTGDWWSPAFGDVDQVRHFEQGERFPATAMTSYGAVIWY